MEYTAIQDKFVFIYGIEPNKQTYRLTTPEASQVNYRHLGGWGGGWTRGYGMGLQHHHSLDEIQRKNCFHLSHDSLRSMALPLHCHLLPREYFHVLV